MLTESRDNERAGAPPPASVGALQPAATMTNNRVHGNKSKADIKRRVTQWISDHPAPCVLVSIHTEAGLMLDPESFSCYSEHPQLNVSKQLGAVLLVFCLFSPIPNTTPYGPGSGALVAFRGST